MRTLCRKHHTRPIDTQGPITNCADATIQCNQHVGDARIWTSEDISYAGSLADLLSHAVDAQKRVETERALLESEARYRRAARLTRTGHHIWDEIEDRAIYCSSELAEMHGISVEEYLRRSATLESNLAWYHPDDRDRYEAVVRQAVVDKTGYDITARIVRDDGEIRLLREVAEVRLDADGNLLQTLGATQDLTDRWLIEEELRTQGEIITNMADGALLIRAEDHSVVYANPAAERMFGYEPAEMIGKPVSQLYQRAISEDPGRDAGFLRGQPVRDSNWKGEVCSLRKNGAEFWCQVNVSAIEHPVHGDVWIFIGSDITERRKTDETLRYQARPDGLTGLINRNEFERRAERLLSRTRQHGGEHALCFMDLDQFKVVNDSCGHTAGDELLRQLGLVLQDTVRPRDTLARLGGDEFGVLLEHCSLGQAEWAVAALQQAVQDFQFIWGDQLFRIGVSIGLVAIDDTTQSLTDLLKHADAACYMAKDLGRNRIHIYRPDDAEISQRHGEMQWITRINRALEDNRFALSAQKILELKNPEAMHFEVLLRMTGDQGELIAPGSFLPAAERYDAMEKLDDWVIEHTLAQLTDFPELTDSGLMVSINLSGQSLTKPKFQQSVLSRLDHFGIDGRNLCFEITETAAIAQLKSARALISALKERGCSFALDDFGRGVSSFGYLKTLPVDYLKIDGMFVRDMANDPIDHAMVKSINEIGQVMGMKTIAEFVEDETTWRILEGLGVDYCQGYGIGKPAPLDSVLRQLQEIHEQQSGKTSNVATLRNA